MPDFTIDLDGVRPRVFKFVSYCTEDYAPHMRRLVESFVRHSYSHCFLSVRVLKKRGDWVQACNYKSRIVCEELSRDPMPTIWVDADAEFVGSLDLLQDIPIDVDVAAHCPAPGQYPLVNSRLLSGTVYFSGSIESITVARDWAAKCSARPHSLDQDTLYDVVQSASARFANLDARLVTIFDLMASVKAPSIVHHQASRVHRD